MDNTDLQKFIDEKRVDAEIITMSGQVKSVAQASSELKVPPRCFIKSIVLASDPPVIAIVNGEDRISTKNVALVLGVAEPKVASPQQALDSTGYAVGGTPPISTGLKTLVDTKVMEMEFVYGGGGTDYHLLRISPKEIIKHSNALIVRVRV